MIRRFLRISRSILEEWTAMFSGRFPPYHKMGIAVALITTAAFSIILSHDVVFEAPVAVIDLDQSRWSAQLIEKLNASPYMQVERVVHSPADPRRMTAHDRVQAVIFIPKDAQASLLRGAQTVRLGTYLDDSNTAQNGELISQLNEITAELSAETAVSRPGGVSALGQTTAGTEALLSPLRMGFRYLANPTGQGATGTVINFLLFFSLMFHGLTSLMIIGRLRVTGVWNASVLSGSLVSLLLRGVPYALIYTTVVTTRHIGPHHIRAAEVRRQYLAVCAGPLFGRHGQYLGGLSAFMELQKPGRGRRAHDLSCAGRFYPRRRHHGCRLSARMGKVRLFRHSARLDLQFLARHWPAGH